MLDVDRTTGPVTRAIRAMRSIEPEPPRRGFLRALAALPLIGGSVSLVGAPTAAAAPITSGMLATYSAWLFYERQALMHGACGAGAGSFVPHLNPGSEFHQGVGSFDEWRFGFDAAQRAPIVLAAVGCPLTSPEAEQQWTGTFRRCWTERS